MVLQVGDWGRRSHFNQSHVAEMMDAKASMVAPEFIVSVGDNFYPSKCLQCQPPHACIILGRSHYHDGPKMCIIVCV